MTLKYENGEWEKVAKVLEDLDCELGTVCNGWGKGIELKAYRTYNYALRSALAEQMCGQNIEVIDDINQPVVYMGKPNLAILRVVPENGEVSVDLDKFLSVKELNDLAKAIAIAYKFISGLIIEAEIKIKVNGGEKNDNRKYRG